MQSAITNNQTQNMLSTINEGWDVIDNTGDKVGRVETVYFGEENLADPGPETVSVNQVEQRDPINQMLQDLLAPDKRIPDEVYSRMQRYGFLRVDRNPLRSDRIVFSDQIKRLDGEQVHLNIAIDEAYSY